MSSLFTSSPDHCHAADVSITGDDLAVCSHNRPGACSWHVRCINKGVRGLEDTRGKQGHCVLQEWLLWGMALPFHMDKLPGGVQLWLQRWLSKEHERPATTSKLIAYHLELWFSDNR